MWAADKLAHEVAPALLARVRELEAERDDLESRLADFLCEVTGGLLSKTGYDARTMIQCTDEYYERRAKEEHDEHCDKTESLEAERDSALSTIAKVREILESDELDGWEHDDWVYRQESDRKLSEIEAALGSVPSTGEGNE